MGNRLIFFIGNDVKTLGKRLLCDNRQFARDKNGFHFKKGLVRLIPSSIFLKSYTSGPNDTRTAFFSVLPKPPPGTNNTPASFNTFSANTAPSMPTLMQVYNPPCGIKHFTFIYFFSSSTSH